MASEFEKMIKNSRPEPPPALRKNVLDAAKSEWQQSDVEQRLVSAQLLPPRMELREEILNAARSEWTSHSAPLNFKRWILATAAVLLFAVGSNWFNNNQNAILQAKIEGNEAPLLDTGSKPTRLADLSELGIGNAPLLGTGQFSSIDTPKKEIAWRYIQAKELNN